MRKLLVRSIAAVVVLAVAYTSWGRETSGELDRTAEINATVQAASDSWRIESMYYAYQNSQRVGGYFGAEQFESEPSLVARERVLVLGDSYTFGTGLQDLDLRWPKQLERELNRGEDRYQVVSLALGGASTITQARIIEHIQKGDWEELSWKNDIEGYFTEDFDTLVVGFVANDVIPGYLDGEEPDYELETRVLQGTQDNPHAEKWLNALATLADHPAKRKLIVLLDFAEPGLSYAKKLVPLFETYGFEVVEREAVSAVVNEFEVNDLIVNPADAHPGPVMLRAYARDVARAIQQGRDSDESGRGGKVGNAGISNVLPETATYRPTSTGGHIIFPDAEKLVEPCGKIQPCLIGGEPFVVAGQERWPRVYSCAPINSPHGYVGLRLKPDQPVRVKVESPNPIWIVPVLVSDEGVLRDGEAVELSVGKWAEIQASGLKGLRVMNTPAAGCAEPVPVNEIQLQVSW
jgi:hypothetical protein